METFSYCERFHRRFKEEISLRDAATGFLKLLEPTYQIALRLLPLKWGKDKGTPLRSDKGLATETLRNSGMSNLHVRTRKFLTSYKKS